MRTHDRPPMTAAEAQEGEHLARGYEDFCPVYDEPMRGWELALVRVGMVGLLAWIVGSIVALAWLLMAYVLPAVPVAAAWIIQAGGRALWGL